MKKNRHGGIITRYLVGGKCKIEAVPIIDDKCTNKVKNHPISKLLGFINLTGR